MFNNGKYQRKDICGYMWFKLSGIVEEENRRGTIMYDSPMSLI